MLYLVICLLFIATFSSAWEPPIIELPYATYRGLYNETTGLNELLGIRYAQPPLGELRWTTAQPVEDLRSQGTIDAIAQPPQCIQRNNMTANMSSEDCLFVNVYAPWGAQNLPVFVWIHGGGWNQFSARDFDPVPMIGVANNSFIAVVIQYRLGAFGFLASDQMLPSNGLNIGITDARFALKWVQDYIGLFGGDKSAVTIGGESAGGGSVLQLLAAEVDKTPQLFANAHMSSPYFPPLGYCNNSFRETQFHNFSSDAGCADDLECLRQVPSETLQQLNWQYDTVDSFSTIGPWVPCLEGPGGYLDFNPAERLQDERVAATKIIAGNNIRDGLGFVPGNLINTTEDEFKAFVASFWPLDADQVDQATTLYPASDFADMANRGGQMFTDAVFACHIDWLYQNYDNDLYRWLYAVDNALHGQDNDIVFPTAGTQQSRASIISTVLGSLTSFFRSGDPNEYATNTPQWSPHGSDYSGPYVVFNISSSTNDSSSYAINDAGDPYLGRQDRCKFWGQARKAGMW